MKKGVDKTGWVETTFHLPEPLFGWVIDAAIKLGWSLETCARVGLIRYAESKGFDLDIDEAGHINVARKSEAKLRGKKVRKFWVKYPQSWVTGAAPLTRLIDQHPVHTSVVGIWREAMAWWCQHDVQVAESVFDGSEAA